MACGWWEAMPAQESPEKVTVVTDARSALLELLLAAPRQSSAMPRLGPLDVVVLQINNRV